MALPKKSKTINCKNCEQPYKKGYKFCPHCGQKTNEDLTMGVLFYNTISNYFSFDARFLKSFLPLMFRPGYLAAKFIEGKRLMYLHPAQMYLFVSVVFFFLSSFAIAEWREEVDSFNQEIIKAPTETDLQINSTEQTIDSTVTPKIIKNVKGVTISVDTTYRSVSGDVSFNWGFNKTKVDSLIATGAKDSEIYEVMGMPNKPNYFQKGFYKSVLNIVKGAGAGSILQAAFDAVPISMFVLLPLFALILKLFYYKKGPYAHHLVFSFYFFSFLFALFAIVMTIDRYLFILPTALSLIALLAMFLYFYLSLLKFYKTHWLTTLIKSGIITFLFTLFISPLTGIILLLFGFLNG